MVDTRGLKKSAVLAALYNASKPQGLGFLHFDPVPMTTESHQSTSWLIKHLDIFEKEKKTWTK